VPLYAHLTGLTKVTYLVLVTALHAGVLVLEELEHAQRRGAPILAEFLGGSFTCDAHHMTEPHPQGHGVRLCIQKCAPCLQLYRSSITHCSTWTTDALCRPSALKQTPSDRLHSMIGGAGCSASEPIGVWSIPEQSCRLCSEPFSPQGHYVSMPAGRA